MNWLDSIKSFLAGPVPAPPVQFIPLRTSWGAPAFAEIARMAYASPVASRSLRLVAQLMASVPFAVRVGGELTDDHEMLGLLRRPSPGQLMDKIVAHLYCAGELYFLRRAPATGPNRGKPTASGGSLTLLNPGRFEDVVHGGNGELLGYRFHTRAGRSVVYDTDEVYCIRVYNPDPNSGRGLPLLGGALRALEMQQSADDWNRSLSAGGGRVPGYFMPRLSDGQAQLSPEQVAFAQEQVDARTRDQSRKGLPQVLSGAFDFKESGMTLKDADFLGASEQMARHIASVIGVPPVLVGDRKAGSLTDSGVNSEIRQTYLLTVLPLVDMVLGGLNEWLGELYGAELTYDRDQIEALSEDVNKMFERMRVATGGAFLTVNEARAAHGYESLGADHDEIRQAAAATPMSGDPMAGVRSAIRAHYAKSTTGN